MPSNSRAGCNRWNTPKSLSAYFMSNPTPLSRTKQTTSPGLPGREPTSIDVTARGLVYLTAFEATFEHSFYPGQTFDVIGPTPDDAIREIRRLVEVGVEHFLPTFEDMATLRRFVDDVLPSIK